MLKNPYMRIFILLILLLVQNAFGYSINVDFFSRFNDCCLENYIKEALYNNHSLKEANHRVEQYRYEISNQFSRQLPSLSISSNYLGAHFPNGRGNFILNQDSYILPLQASYEPDFLLKYKDMTQSKKYLYKAQIQNQKATYISLLTDVANAYINILLFDYLIEKQCEILKNKTLDLSYQRKKFNSGVIDYTELNNKTQDLKTQETIYENLIKNQRTTLYNLSALIGQSANNWEDLKRGKLEDFEYQETIPDIINSDLIYSRPDILEIENKLKSAKIDITVAKKDFFPSFNITGFLIFDTAGPGNFFSWESSFALLLAGVTQDLFKGGAKLANLRIKKARYCELIEQYKQADLNAIKEINNALNLIKEDKITEYNSKTQLELEKKNFNSSNKKLKRGVISNSDYLDDKISLSQKEQIFASSKALRLMDYITLYKALGGQL